MVHRNAGFSVRDPVSEILTVMVLSRFVVILSSVRPFWPEVQEADQS